MPGKQLTLSTGESVTFKPYYTHSADLAYSEVRYAQDYEGKTPLAVVMAAIDATLPVVIETVAKDGQTSKATKEWLGELPLADYELLYQALMELRQESQAGLEAGKKNG